MTSVLGLRVPPGISSTNEPAPKKTGFATPKNLALGGIAATGLIGGGVIGAMRGNPLKGLAIGGAVAAVALGAALLGNGASQRDGFCDYYGDPDCDYPGTYNPDPYYPRDDYPRNDYPRDYPRYDDYPTPYPGGGTSHGDDY
jgi:hypothetical protein